MATITTRSGKGSPLTNTELDANFTNLNTDKVEKSGDSMTGNLTFGDNDKAIFGAGSDLQIYHDGSNSYITEGGTGDLVIYGANLRLGAAGTGEQFIRCYSNDRVDLYYDNAIKLATTSTGIDVTGTVTADGSYIQASPTIGNDSLTLGFTAPNGSIKVKNSSGSPAANLDLHTTDASGNTYLRQRVSYNGDISFYEDTGTTAKFFWDASAESLGIGTSSPQGDLDVVGEEYIRAGSDGVAGAGGVLWLTHGTQSSVRSAKIEAQTTGSNDNALAFYTNAAYAAPAERMRIDSSGNVGIGTTPAGYLTSGYVLRLNGSSAQTYLAFNNSTYTTQVTGGFVIGMDNASANIIQRENLPIKVYTNDTERMRIDSSGNLLVGTTNSSPTVNNVEGGGIIAGGQVQGSKDGASAASFNRKGTDGSIINLRKDGTTVGVIGGGFGGNDMYIGTNDVGVRFDDAVDTIYPVSPDGTGSNRDGGISLGYPTIRFKDLYLSGGVYLGGTGSANYLDDYETGTWTPSVGGTATYTNTTGQYTKVGKMVFIRGTMQISTIGTGHTQVISGLPFTSDHEYTMSISKLVSSTYNFYSAQLRTSGSGMYLSGQNGLDGTITVNQSYMQSGTEIQFSGCYLAT